MKHVWNVHGVYFHWELTVKVRPVEHPPYKITLPQQGSAIVRMKRIGPYFHDLVSLHEYSLDLDNSDPDLPDD